MKTGTFKLDGIALYSIKYEALPTGVLKGHLALVNSKTGASMGSAEHTKWSPKTREALAALIEAMEEDIAGAFFESYQPAGGAEEPGGLGEYLGAHANPDAPDV